MNFSYWERESFLSDIDVMVVGGGITGLVAALRYKQKFPNKRVVIAEKGALPSGASTRNAGFACFGSAGEMLADIDSIGESALVELVRMRKEGLDELINILGEDKIELRRTGSFEVFTHEQEEHFDFVAAKCGFLNKLLKPIFEKDVLIVDEFSPKHKGVPGASHIISHKQEGTLNTGQMMKHLIAKTKEAGVEIWNGFTITGWEESSTGLSIHCAMGSVSCQQLLFATNAFTKDLIPDIDIVPARNQVLVSAPMSGLKMDGAYHHKQGYVYLRNIGNRLLIGGARYLDWQGETTSDFSTTPLITNHLMEIASSFTQIKNIEWEMNWSGIMGVGSSRETIIKSHSKRVHIGVRLGGMGVAIGSLVGRRLANLAMSGIE